MIIAIIILLVISNVLSWAVIIRLASEMRIQNIINNGIRDVLEKEVLENETKAKI